MELRKNNAVLVLDRVELYLPIKGRVEGGEELRRLVLEVKLDTGEILNTDAFRGKTIIMEKCTNCFTKVFDDKGNVRDSKHGMLHDLFADYRDYRDNDRIKIRVSKANRLIGYKAGLKEYKEKMEKLFTESRTLGCMIEELFAYKDLGFKYEDKIVEMDYSASNVRLNNSLLEEWKNSGEGLLQLLRDKYIHNIDIKVKKADYKQIFSTFVELLNNGEIMNMDEDSILSQCLRTINDKTIDNHLQVIKKCALYHILEGIINSDLRFNKNDWFFIPDKAWVELGYSNKLLKSEYNGIRDYIREYLYSKKINK